MHDGEGAIAQNIVGLRFNHLICHPKYAYYLLTDPTNRARVKNLDISSVQPSVKVPHLLALEFDLPGISDQKAIAHILGTLDDKIELNRKMNETLEEIAKAIFRSWFVDFDPVRAKMEGRPTGLPDDIAALFPDRLVDSEIGQIPERWEAEPLSAFLFDAGKRTKPSRETESNPYVPIDCIEPRSMTLYNFKDGSEAKSSLIAFNEKDILFGAMRPYFHKVCIAPFHGTTRSTCLVLNSRAPHYYSFAFLTLFADSTIEFATQNSTGSTIPYIKWDNELATMKVAFPGESLATVFNEAILPIFAKIKCSANENKVLSELRDTLLPKLISGELQVPDAEKFLKEASI